MGSFNRGFLRGEILVRVRAFTPDPFVRSLALQAVLCILLGPSVAHTGEGSGVGGYADRFRMRSITTPTIAFAATVVSYLTSSRTQRGRKLMHK